MSFQMPLNPAVGIDLESYDGHAGIDFAVPENTPVIAAEGGRVVRAAPHRLGEPNNPSAFGNLVAILHDDGTVSLYAHLSAYETSNYTVGAEGQDRVEQGDVIGYSGNTGFVIGENGGFHLHFSILDLPEGVFINATGDSIFGFEPGFTGSMDVTESTFSLTSTPAAIASIAPAFVDQLPNDPTTTAVLIDDGAEDSWTLTNAIEFAGDTDFIRFTAVAGEMYRVQVDGAIDRDIDELSDTFFRIRSALTPDQSIPETASDAHDDVVGTSAAISWTPDLSGDYFISVGAGGADFASLHGGYSLSINRENGSSGATAPALPGGAEKLLAGTFLARAVYGGGAIRNGFRNDQSDADEFKYDDDYDGYLSGLATPWHVLTDAELGGEFFTFAGNTLGSFTSGGLYLGEGDTPLSWTETNKAEALLAWTLIDGQKTLVLSFRGSDGTDAFFQGQTFTASGAAAYYDALQPIIKATLAYASDPSNGISDVIVSGHSLAGTMADIFTLLDTTNPILVGAKSFLDADVDISVVSLASAGVPRNIDGLLDLRDELITFSTGSGHIDAVTAPDFYTSINHSEDRVYYADETEGGLGLAFNSAITNDGGPFPPGNVNFASNLDIDLPNIENTDVVYEGGFFFHGFGAEHNPELYWNNVSALLRHPLYGNFGNQNIIIGNNDYDTKSIDYDGSSIPIFQPYTGGFGADNDRGSIFIPGTNAADYILGLSGDDSIVSLGGNDLLSGGEGNDFLKGALGRDILHGGDGDDILIGGGSASQDGSEGDTLFGGAGSDVFRYSAGDLPPSGTPEPVILPHGLDEIVDFNQGNGGFYDPSEADRIDLSEILGTVYADGAGENVDSLIRLRQSSFIDRVLLEIDVDGASSGQNWTPLALLSGLAPGGEVDFILDPSSSTTDEIVSVTGVPGSWQISPTSQSVIEGSGQIQFAVTRPNDTLSETVFISTTVVHGAQNEGDYDPFLNDAFTFQPGETSATFSIAIDDDGIAEVSETFGFIVQSSPDQSASDFLAAAAFTIQDDDQIAPGGTLTNGDDWIFVNPTPATQSFEDPAGRDRATLDYSSFAEAIDFGRNGSSATNYAGRVTSDLSHFVSLSRVEDFVVSGGSGNDRFTASNNGNHVFVGNDGDDDLTSTGGNDGLFGGAGNDGLFSGIGNDVIHGGAGNDDIVASEGADAIDGGSGIDRLNLQRGNLTEALTAISNSDGSASFTLEDGTVVSNIETLRITTGSGDDDVTFIDPGEATQFFDGSAGRDRATLDYSSFAEAIDFGRNGSSATNYAGRVTSDLSHFVSLSRVEDFVVSGGSGNDRFTASNNGNHVFVGNDGDDDLTSTGGNDGLFGGAGNDGLFSGIGNDVIHGGAGNDDIVASEGADAIDGGSGIDRLNLQRGNLTEALTAISNSDGSASFTLEDGTVVSNIETLRITTGSGDDDVTFIDPGEATQFFDGSAGRDRATLDYSSFAEAIDFGRNGSSATNYAGRVTSDLSHFVSLSRVEDFVVSGGSGNDRFTASNNGNHVFVGNDGDDDLTSTGGNDGLFGGAGNDGLFSGIGNDVIHGGAGNDDIVASEGADAIDGGSGIDRLNLQRGNLTEALTAISNSDGSASFTLEDGTVVSNIETLRITTGSGDDDVTFIDPGEATQFFDGSAGRDRATLDYSSFAEAIDFGRNGSSATNYAGRVTSDLSHFVSLSRVEDFVVSGGSGNDRFTASNNGNHVFVGNDGDDDLTSTGGNDGLFGGAGNDGLFSGIGNDVIHGGAGNDDIVASEGADAIDGGSGIDRLNLQRGNLTEALTAISNSDGSASFTLEDGTVVSNIETLRITTGSGDDDVTFIDPGEATQFFDGSAGRDRATLDYSSFAEAIDFGRNGSSATNYAGRVTSDLSHFVSLSRVEDFVVSGGSGNDRFTASNNGNHVFVGNDGDDDLTSTGGNDGLFGGAGNDGLFSGIGNDVIHGGAGNDDIRAGTGNDTLDGGVGADTLEGGLGNDRFFVDDAGDIVIEGVGEGTDLLSTSVDYTLPDNVEQGSSLGTGDVAITGNALANFITGNAGANTIDGAAGNDRLITFDGDDVLTGGQGNDILEGGAGSDRFVITVDNGDDQIIGWEASTDILDFDALGLRFVDLAITSSGNEALITFDDPAGGTGSVRLIDIDPEVLEIGIMSDPGGVGSPGGIPLVAGTSAGENLAGSAAGDDLIGLAGSDTLNGRAGDDTMLGGFGDDRYLLDDAGDIALELEFQGIDQVDTRFDLVLGANIERAAVRGGGAVDITGNELDNFITGSDLQNVLIGGDGRDRLIARAGNDTLDGGLDRDVLEGGTGEDVFVFGADSDVDLITDFVVGEDLIDVSALGIAFADMTIVDGALGALVIFDAAPGSVDLVTLQGVSAADVRLASFIGAPNLPIVGTENDDVLRGTVEDDELQGLGGADQVDGLAGADTLIGGDGDDRYFVDDAGDVVTELAGEGTDLVSTLVDFTLPEHVENGSALGTGDVDLTGNAVANALTGNDGANVLTGLGGDDNLQGKAGADTIDGGAGFDVLRGGADADVFRFAPGDGATGDQIIDFEIGLDIIDLSATGLAFGDLTIVDVGANASVTYGVDTLTVLNTAAAELDQNTFDLGA